MFNNTIYPNDISVDVPLSSVAHVYAKRFAQRQANRAKKIEVYHNTLAVFAVKEYLNWFNIATDLEVGDSWNQITQMLGNVADLEVVGHGRLECRAIFNNERICQVPPEAWCDRLAYVAVQLEPPYREAKILGFVKILLNGEFLLENLEPMEDLLENLSKNTQSAKITLSEWLAGIVTTGWEPFENFLTDSRLAWRSSNQISGFEPDLTWGKVLNLGVQMGVQSLILLISVKPDSNSSLIISVRLQPSENQRYLPRGISLALLSQTAEQVQGVEARNYDNFIQLLPFRGQLEEPFRLKVKYNQYVLEEDFVI